MRIGLQARFGLAIAAAILLALLVLGAAWLQQRRGDAEVAGIGQQSMHEMARASLAARGQTIARLLADALTNPMYFVDLATIGEVARSALNEPDVAYVLVFDADGRVVHDGSGDIPSFGEPMDDPFAFEAVAARAPRVQWSTEVVDVVHPIRIADLSLGGVRVGLSLDGVERVERAAQQALAQRLSEASGRNLSLLAGWIAALVALGLTISLLVSRGLVQPIRRLANAARRMEKGDFATPLRSARSDEIGELTRAFAGMSASLARHDREIRRLAYSDALTGLPNRLAFRDLLDRRLPELRAADRQLALLFIDLDDFKRVNDTLGHDAGDEVLGQFAQRLQGCVRLSGDDDARVARFGGDEFVALIAAEAARDAAAHVADAVLAELQHPMQVRERQVFLGASIGITLFPGDADEASALLKNGDIAMYQAKVAGKNCYRFYSRAMDQAVERRVQLEHDLRGAWERGELTLSYQPIFQLANGRMVGAEALLRWQHPRHGTILPSVFIEVAEQTGLIEALGRQVLERACVDALRWPPTQTPLFVSVNVSARQLRSGALPDTVTTALRDSGLPAVRLHLELTETAVLGDELQASALLARLRAMGVRIWLDDFGTGFSGLSHLRRVPVDGVKIDRSFIADVLRDPDDLALTSAIVAMAHSLGITVVAEGVENEGQFAVLRDRGCDQAQGFWLGRPMSVEELQRRIMSAEAAEATGDGDPRI